MDLKNIKQIINAAVFRIDPQRGAISALKRENYAMSELALTLRASRQSERNENDKLRQWQHRTEAEWDEARYGVAALTAEVERLESECKERVAEKMEWLSERSQLNKEVERLNAMVTYDCRESGVCPDLQDVTDALQLVTEQKDGAAALLKSIVADLTRAREENERLRGALEQIAGSTMSMYASKDHMLTSLLADANRAIEIKEGE